MRYVAVLSMIIIFWFLLGTGLSFIAQDESLREISDENYSSFNQYANIDEFNSSSQDSGDTSTGSAIGSSLAIMFGFRVPSSAGGMPQGIAIFLSFINWFLFVLAIVCVYKIVNPLSSG
jgi:hypothetical protein